MPYFEDSYKTTVGAVLNTSSIESNIKKCMVTDLLSRENLNVRDIGDVLPVFVTGAVDSESNIPPFAHPIMILSPHKEKTLCSDMRYFLRKDPDAREIENRIRNLTEFNFAKGRAIINLMWVTERVGQVRSDFQFAGTVFAAVISEAIARNYALDIRDKLAVNIATHFYYQSLFTSDTEFDEDARQKMAIHTINATKAPSELVYQVIDKIKTIEGVNDFCKVLPEIVDNVRLKDFNLAILFTILKNSWYGTNSKEILTVAVEHPPTWIAVVYSALSERTYRNTMVYQVAEKIGKRGGIEEFVRNYVAAIKDNVKTNDGPRRALEMLTDLQDNPPKD